MGVSSTSYLENINGLADICDNAFVNTLVNTRTNLPIGEFHTISPKLAVKDVTVGATRTDSTSIQLVMPQSSCQNINVQAKKL